MIGEVFDLGQLRTFEAVARTGSFTKAAGVLGLAQSSVSQQIHRFETRLERTLLERHGRGIKLTQAGEATLIYARSMLALADQARRQFSEQPLNGPLRLGVVEDFATAKLGSVFAVFQKQHPRFELTFETGLSTSLFNALDAGDLDVVVAKRLPGRKKGSLLWQEPLVWVGRSDVISDGGNVPLATYPAPSETRDLMLAALQTSGRRWSVVTQSTGLLGIIAAVEAGLGVAAFGSHFVPAHLQELPADLGLPQLGMLDYVIDQKAGPSDPVLETFVVIIRTAVAQLMEVRRARSSHPET